jgi:hypothetical protein
MKQFGKSALLFVAIGLLIYAGLSFATERLLLRNGHSNPFFKIATAEANDYDWVILGASHAMPLDFGDFNALMQRETGLRILNLAAQGTGPLYNRFVLEHFLRAHHTRNLLYVVDSFAFTSRAWNEDRFADGKLIRGTPFAPAIARRLGNYVRRDGVDPRALLDYLSGFSKINNRDRFQRDAWEGEAQFDRVYRSSATAVAQRIAYLYPDATTPELCARYLKQFADLIATAREHGIRVIAIKLPLPALFRDRLPNEAAFDGAVRLVLTEQAVPLRDFSAALDNSNFYFDTDHLNRAGVTESFQQLLKPLLMTPGRLTRTSMR